MNKHFFNPYMPSGLVDPYVLDESICHLRGVWCTFTFILFLMDIPVSKQWRP